MEIPKGKLIAIGGNEDKGNEHAHDAARKHNVNYFELQILSRIVEELRSKKQAVIEIITSASSISQEVGENYVRVFEKLGCTHAGILHIKSREDAQMQEHVERLKNCEGVLFTGGNQLRLTSFFGGTEFQEILLERYMNEDFVIAGTSAGAMAMSNTMIYHGSSSGALIKGEVKITTGLGFIKNVIIDSHFDKRGRFGRLAHAVASNPSCIGLGLGEDTGVLITEGNQLEAIGSGLVVIVDGHEIRHSNIADQQEGSPISIERMIVHVMNKGNYYNLKERKFFAEMIPVKN
ncbi:MAG: cyanophycinase [Bacteroidota bacterium]